jgi:hypothetical protein
VFSNSLLDAPDKLVFVQFIDCCSSDLKCPMEIESRNGVSSIDEIFLYFCDMFVSSTLRSISIATGAASVVFDWVSSQEDSMDRVNSSTDRLMRKSYSHWRCWSFTLRAKHWRRSTSRCSNRFCYRLCLEGGADRVQRHRSVPMIFSL